MLAHWGEERVLKISRQHRSWLANNATTRASGGLRAGEFVLLGSLAQTRWLEHPCEVRVINNPLGEIVARFE